MALGQHQPVVPRVLDQPAPVFTNRCCKLVNDQLLILFGSTKPRTLIVNEVMAGSVGPMKIPWARQ